MARTAPTYVGTATSIAHTTADKAVTRSPGAIGNWLFIVETAGDNNNRPILPTATNYTFVPVVSPCTGTAAAVNIGTTAQASIGAWYETAKATSSTTFNETNQSTAAFGGDLVEYSGSGGIGAVATANSGTSNATPSVSITTVADNSDILVMITDWNDGIVTPRTWLTVSGATLNEIDCQQVSSAYTLFFARYTNVGTAGAKTVGLSAPTSQRYVMSAWEVLGTDSTFGPLAIQTGSIASAASPTFVAQTSFAPSGSPNKRAVLLKFDRSGGLATGTVTGITDTGGNTWTYIDSAAVSGSSNTRTEWWYIKPADFVATPGTITVASGTPQTNAYEMVMFDNVDPTTPLNTNANVGLAATTAKKAPDITPTADSCLVVAGGHWTLAGNTALTSGWVPLPNHDDAAGSGRAAYKVLGTSTSGVALTGPTWTTSSAAGGMVTVAFNLASSSTPKTGSETFTATEGTSQFLPLLSVVDSGALSDASSPVDTLATTDTGTLSDSSSVAATAPISATDSGTLTDSSSSQEALSVTDSGTLSDSSALAVTTNISATDSGTLTDSSASAKASSVTDSGTLSDSSAVGNTTNVSASDSGTLTDSSASAEFLSRTESITFGDSSAVGTSTYSGYGNTNPGFSFINDTSDDIALSVGQETSLSYQQIVGVRFYVDPSVPNDARRTGAVGYLYGLNTIGGYPATPLLAGPVSFGTLVDGWNEAFFATPFDAVAGVQYYGVVWTKAGVYSALGHAYDSDVAAPSGASGLKFFAGTSGHQNGTYRYGAFSIPPDNSFNNTSYGVDMLWQQGLVPDAKSATDSGTLSDSSVADKTNLVSVTDTGTLTDTSAVVVPRTATDSGTLTDTSVSVPAVSASDSFSFGNVSALDTGGATVKRFYDGTETWTFGNDGSSDYMMTFGFRLDQAGGTVKKIGVYVHASSTGSLTGSYAYLYHFNGSGEPADPMLLGAAVPFGTLVRGQWNWVDVPDYAITSGEVLACGVYMPTSLYSYRAHEFDTEVAALSGATNLFGLQDSSAHVNGGFRGGGAGGNPIGGHSNATSYGIDVWIEAGGGGSTTNITGTDSATLGDSSSVSGSSTPAASQSITFGEAVSIGVTTIKSASDDLTMYEDFVDVTVIDAAPDGTLGESSGLAITASRTDSFTLSDSSSVSVPGSSVSGTDSGSFSDSSSLVASQSASGTDSFSLTDISLPPLVTLHGVEAFGFLESVAVAVAILGSDVFTALDHGAITGGVPSKDHYTFMLEAIGFEFHTEGRGFRFEPEKIGDDS